MKKYFVSVFTFLFVFIIKIHVVHAALEINEIMYDPKGANAGHQWIEVYNSGSDQVSIDDTWRFNDGSSHYINDKDAFVVPSAFYFILTGDKDTFLADHPSYAGTVIDTSMSLDKDGDTVSLLQDGQTMTEATYTSSMGGSQNGNSLQKINNTWVEGIPTPGVANVITPSVPAPVVSQTPAPVVSNASEIIESTPVVVTNNPPEVSAPAVVNTPVVVNNTPTPNPIVSVLPTPIPVPTATPIQPVITATPIPLPEISPIVKATSTKAKTTKKKPKDTTASAAGETSQDSIDLSNLGADAGEAKTNTVILPTLAWVGLGFVIIIGFASMLFMKKKKPKITTGDEEEEELDPEDLALVE